MNKLDEYMTFMLNRANSHHCEGCPENMNYDCWEGKLPCGQQNCWVDVHCDWRREEDDE